MLPALQEPFSASNITIAHRAPMARSIMLISIVVPPALKAIYTLTLSKDIVCIALNQINIIWLQEVAKNVLSKINILPTTLVQDVPINGKFIMLVLHSVLIAQLAMPSTMPQLMNARPVLSIISTETMQMVLASLVLKQTNIMILIKANVSHAQVIRSSLPLQMDVLPAPVVKAMTLPKTNAQVVLQTMNTIRMAHASNVLTQICILIKVASIVKNAL